MDLHSKTHAVEWECSLDSKRREPLRQARHQAPVNIGRVRPNLQQLHFVSAPSDEAGICAEVLFSSLDIKIHVVDHANIAACSEELGGREIVSEQREIGEAIELGNLREGPSTYPFGFPEGC